MARHDYEITQDEHGQKVVHVPLPLMDGNTLHKPGTSAASADAEARTEAARDAHETMLRTAWRAGKSPHLSIPQTSDDPYQSYENFISDAWKTGGVL